MIYRRCGAPWWSCRARVFATFLTVHSIACVGAYEIAFHGLHAIEASVHSHLSSHPLFYVPPTYAEPRSPSVSAGTRKLQLKPLRSRRFDRIVNLHRNAQQSDFDVINRGRHEASLVEMNMFNKMGWLAGEGSNEALLEKLRRSGFIRSQRVFNTMLQVDRGKFISTSPYKDTPQSIGYGATISAPHMHAKALEELEPNLQPGGHALDVGSGTGYLTVCMAKMVGVGSGSTEGAAVGIDYIPKLVMLSRRNVRHFDPSLLNNRNFVLEEGDGWKGGPAEFAPYNAIHVGAAAPSVPKALLEQLAPGGKMIIPVELYGCEIEVEGTGKVPLEGAPCSRGIQVLISVERSASGSHVSYRYLMSVLYVPLVKS